jgi:hypothetical protein
MRKILFLVIVIFAVSYALEAVLMVSEFFIIENRKKTLEINIAKQISENKYDQRKIYESYLESKDSKDLLVSPKIFKNSKTLLPLGLKPNEVYFTYEKEHGNFPYYVVDKYGFRNPEGYLDNQYLNTVIIGDSFLIPGEYEDSISKQIEKIINEKVVTLAQGSYGMLYYYAMYKEYLIDKNVTNLLIFYFEPNDLQNLGDELNIKILRQYLYDDEFKQNLIKKVNEVKNFYIESESYQFSQDEGLLKERYDKNIIEIMNFYKFFTLEQFFKLWKTRNFLYGKYSEKPVDEFTEIMKKFKFYTKKNNTNLIFVYVPSINRYSYNKIFLNNNSKKRSKILEILNKLKIFTIDLHEEVYLKYNDPTELFPYSAYGHNNQLANITIARYLSDFLR